jgi:hypothetical protein
MTTPDLLSLVIAGLPSAVFSLIFGRAASRTENPLRPARSEKMTQMRGASSKINALNESLRGSNDAWYGKPGRYMVFYLAPIAVIVAIPFLPQPAAVLGLFLTPVAALIFVFYVQWTLGTLLDQLKEPTYVRSQTTIRELSRAHQLLEATFWLTLGETVVITFLSVLVLGNTLAGFLEFGQSSIVAVAGAAGLLLLLDLLAYILYTNTVPLVEDWAYGFIVLADGAPPTVRVAIGSGSAQLECLEGDLIGIGEFCSIKRDGRTYAVPWGSIRVVGLESGSSYLFERPRTETESPD